MFVSIDTQYIIVSLFLSSKPQTDKSFDVIENYACHKPIDVQFICLLTIAKKQTNYRGN